MSEGQSKQIYKGYKLTSKREFLKKLGYKPTLKRWVEGPICEKTKQLHESILELDEEHETKKHDIPYFAGVFYSNWMYIPEGRRTIKQIFNKKQTDKNWTHKNGGNKGFSCKSISTSVVKWNEKVVVCDSDSVLDLVDGKKPGVKELEEEEKINMLNYNILLDWIDEHYFDPQTKIWKKIKNILTPKEIFDQTVLLFVKSLRNDDDSKSEWVTFFLLESLAYCNDHDAKHNTQYAKELSNSVDSILIILNMKEFIKIMKTLKWMPKEIKQRSDPPVEKNIERVKNEK